MYSQPVSLAEPEREPKGPDVPMLSTQALHIENPLAIIHQGLTHRRDRISWEVLGSFPFSSSHFARGNPLEGRLWCSSWGTSGWDTSASVKTQQGWNDDMMRQVTPPGTLTEPPSSPTAGPEQPIFVRDLLERGPYLSFAWLLALLKAPESIMKAHNIGPGLHRSLGIAHLGRSGSLSCLDHGHVVRALSGLTTLTCSVHPK